MKLLESRVWWLLGEYQAKAEHSEQQCREYLTRKEFHPSLIHKAITIAKDKKYIDDARFAEILIRSLLDRGKSKRYIIQKLFTHRIPESLYLPLLSDAIDPEYSRNALREMIENYAINTGNCRPSNRRRRYSPPCIARALIWKISPPPGMQISRSSA